MATRTETANKALDFLLATQSWKDTKSVLGGIGINFTKSNLDSLKTILDELYRAGRVRRVGAGKFKWLSNADAGTWDRNDPFAPVPGHQNQQSMGRGTRAATGTLMVRLGGQTREKRFEIKQVPGWHYDPNLKSWSVPKTEQYRRWPAGVYVVPDSEWMVGSAAASGTGEEIEPDPVPHNPPTPEPKPAGWQETEDRNDRVGRLETKVRGIDSMQAIQDDKITKVAERSAGTYLDVMGLKKELEKTRKELEEVRSSVNTTRTVKVERWDGSKVKIAGAVPKVFADVLELVGCGEPVLLVGPAGSGKSTVAKLVAKALKYKFGKVGGSGGLTEEHLLGWARPNLTGGKDRYVSTPFLDCFEGGGLVLIDELDGADQNVLLALNPALDDSGELPLPNRGNVAVKHEDFRVIATANTFGKGADRVYAGRNQLDESTLDRFRAGLIEMDYDRDLEAGLVPDVELREWFWKVRDNCTLRAIRRVVSTRALVKFGKMKAACDWSMQKMADRFFEGWSRDEREKATAA